MGIFWSEPGYCATESKTRRYSMRHLPLSVLNIALRRSMLLTPLHMTLIRWMSPMSGAISLRFARQQPQYDCHAGAG